MKRLQEIDAGVLVGLFGPLTAYLVWWKLQRLRMLPEWPGWGLIDLLRPELLLHAGLLVGFGALLARFAHRPRPVRAALALSYLLLGAVEFLCHSHFTTSGAAMDAGLFAYALRNLDGLGAAFGDLSLGVAAVGGLLLLAPLPWLLSPPAELAPASGMGRFGALSALLLALSLLPPISTTVPRSVARHSVGHLLLTVGREAPAPLDAPAWSESSITWKPTTNLVIISLESVRYSATSLDDPARGVTPALAELASRGLSATHAYANMPHSTKAMVPMLCGIPPDPVLRVHESSSLPLRCLPARLRERGYRTAHFRSATEHFENWRGLCDQLGFEDFVPPEELETEGFEQANYFGYEDDILLDPISAWLDEEPERPFFAFVLAGTPHHDYQVPARPGEERTWDEQDELFDSYLRAVNYTDGFVRQLMERLEERGRLEDTIVLIVGDHGEGFGEHLPRQHNTNPYEEGLRVPLVLFGPGIPVGVIQEPVSHLDLLPTLVQALGGELDGDLQGLSLLQPIPERNVFASCWYNARCLVRWRGQDKHIHHFGDLPDQRFDLLLDPLERRPLQADPEAIQELMTWYRTTRGRWQASARQPAP